MLRHLRAEASDAKRSTRCSHRIGPGQTGLDVGQEAFWQDMCGRYEVGDAAGTLPGAFMLPNRLQAILPEGLGKQAVR